MRLVSPFSKTKCPLCSYPFHLTEAPIRMPANVKSSRDSKLGKQLDINPPDLGAIRPQPRRSFVKRLMKRSVLSSLGAEDGIRVCPECHFDLPPKTSNGEIAQTTIAVVGGRSSGKSNYIGVLLKILKEHFGPALSLQTLWEPTFDIRSSTFNCSGSVCENRYWQYLFDPREPRPVPQTQLSDKQVRVPLILRIEFDRVWQDYLSPWKVPAVELVLYDTAGEFLRTQKDFDEFASYAGSADALIIALDPDQTEGLQQFLPDEQRVEVERGAELDQQTMLDTLLRHFETVNHTRGGTGIDIPVAFTMMKSDVFKDLIHENSPIRREAGHFGGFDLDDSEHVSSEMRQYLAQWDCPVIGNAKMFRRHRFFASSALGHPTEKNEHGDERIVHFAPRRVADPLLWILSELGFLRARSVRS